MKRFLGMISAAVFILIFFTSCASFKTGIDGLIVPPLLRNDQKEIMSVLQKQSGQSVVLKYPVTGNNTSPFITHDLDKDGEDEVIAFYSSVASEKVKLALLNKTDGKWEIAFSLEGDGNSVMKADLIRFKGVSANNLIVGFTGSASGDVLTVYDLDSSGDVVCSYPFTEYQIVSFGVGIRESFAVFNLTGGAAEKQQAVSYHTYTAEGAVVSDLISGSTEISSYRQVTASVMPDFSALIYVDSMVNNSIMTEVFRITDGKVSCALPLGCKRSIGIYCTDINGDGYPEIPSVVSYTGNSAADNASSLITPTRWFKMTGDTLVKVCDTAVNLNFGYALKLPERFENKIVLSQNDAGNALTAYVYTGDVSDLSKEIFTLRTVYASDASDIEGYTKIKESNSVVYLAKVNNKIYDIDKNLEISYDEIKNCLIML